MAKTTFLKKKPMANIGQVVGTNLIRGAAVVATASVDGLISPKIENETARKVIGPAAILLGMAGEIFIENPYLRAPAEGVGAYGYLKTAKDFIPTAMKEKIGLAGIGQDKPIEVDGTPNWKELADKAELNSQSSYIEEGFQEEVPEFESREMRSVSGVGKTNEEAVSAMI